MAEALSLEYKSIAGIAYCDYNTQAIYCIYWSFDIALIVRISKKETGDSVQSVCYIHKRNYVTSKQLFNHITKGV